MKEKKEKKVYKSAKEMKNRTLGDSVRCAFQGLVVAFKTEKNFAIYCGIGLFFLIVNILVGVPLGLYIPYALSVGGVFSSELLNTAIEHVANFISDEIRDEIKYVKDIAAGAVLFFGAVYFLVEFIIVWVTLN